MSTTIEARPRARTGRDEVRIALYRLELSILPHVRHEHELRRRLIRMEGLRSGLLCVDQSMLIREFDAIELPDVAF